MRPKATLALLCLAAALVAAPPSARANEGRAEALAGNPLVADDTDIASLPGLLTTYGDLVFLSIRDNASTGDVGAVVGRDLAFGLWVHRTPLWDDLADTDALFDSFVLPTTHPLVDLFFGMSNGFGLRLSLSAGLENDEEPDEDDAVVSTGGSTFAADLQAGYSVDLDEYHGDFAAGLTLSTFEVLNEGVTTYGSGLIPSFDLRHRSVVRPRTPVAWAFDVQLTRRAYSARSEGDPAVEGAMDRWVASAVAGPQLTLPGDLTLWLGAALRLERLGGLIDEQEQPAVLGLGPGVVASAELLLFDILTIRAGVLYDFFWARSDTPETELTARETHEELGQRFLWSVGLGLSHAGFSLDGTLSDQLLFGGPDAVGGRAPGFLGTVSASYAW